MGKEPKSAYFASIERLFGSAEKSIGLMPRNDIALRQWGSLIDRKLNSIDVIGALTDLLVLCFDPSMFIPTTAQDSSPRSCQSRARPSAQRQRSFSSEVLGRMVVRDLRL